MLAQCTDTSKHKFITWRYKEKTGRIKECSGANVENLHFKEIKGMTKMKLLHSVSGEKEQKEIKKLD